jgi:uncharacterized protein (TIGR03437 family)
MFERPMTMHFTRIFLLAAMIATASSGICQTPVVTSVSAADYQAIVAPNSIVSGWGTNLAATTTPGTITNGSLPTTLSNVQLTLVDNSKATSTPTLYMVSPTQINYVLPAGTALGAATLTVKSQGNTVAQGPVLVSNVAPALFTFSATGMGVPAAQVITLTPNGQLSYGSPVQSGSSTFAPSPIVIGSNQVYLALYGTGFRQHSLNPVIVTINGISVPVTYAGAQSQFPGLDQIDVGPLPTSLAGAGTVNLIVKVDGAPANTVQVAFQ